MPLGQLKLDNPVWYSLQETHEDYAIHYKNVSFYHPEYCPFGGFISESGIANEIDRYAKLTSTFFIVGEKPTFNTGITMVKELICEQMVLVDRIDGDITEDIVSINQYYKKELHDLVNLVQPGYFRSNTSELGSYYGIIKEGKLVAVTGERMKMNNYTEVSAVVTHPDHTGKGYAKQLIAFTANRIFDQNIIPYLHVAETNSAAIGLYRKLGFKTRRKISFWTFQG